MTDFGDDFNAETVAPSTGFDCIPAGAYLAKIIESDRQPISKNDDKGDCIVLTWEIVEGPHQGRKVWQRLNLFWRGPEKTPGKVKEIAQQQLSAICHATGQIAARNTDALLQRPCVIKVAVIVDPNGNYDDKNDIKRVSAANGSSGGSSASQRSQPQQGSQQRAPATNASRWNRPAA